GSATLASRVHGKFSIHDAWEAALSVSCTFAHVRGAFHQLWNLTHTSVRSLIHSPASERAGSLPPCPFRIRIRLKPCPARLSKMSRTTGKCVDTRSDTVPGKQRKYGVMPYASTGNTAIPSGSAASNETRSDKMLSTLRLRYACCSVLPSGSTQRSSLLR